MAAQELGSTSINGGHLYQGNERHEEQRNGCGQAQRKSKDSLASEQLFPGILNEITLDLIVPKLSWRVLLVLSTVNRAWEEAIRSNRVYEERVRAKSGETLIIHDHVYGGREAVALYSKSESRCYELPPIPCLPSGVLTLWSCVAVCGRIYILGGMELSGQERVLEGGRVEREPLCSDGFAASREVYVLDLGRGRGKWERCASMLQPRYSFVCGVIDEKIYVFGGRSKVLKGITKPISLLQCEVYDTHENSWSAIMPMGRMVRIDGVAIAAPVGKELFLYNEWTSAVGVYNPAKNDWRFEKLFWESRFPALVFVIEGNFYSISSSGIDMYDAEQNSWINWHTHCFAAFRPVDSAEFVPLSIVAVNHELFLVAYWRMLNNSPDRSSQSFHCKGFDSEKTELVWQKANCSSKRTLQSLRFPIQL